MVDFQFGPHVAIRQNGAAAIRCCPYQSNRVWRALGSTRARPQPEGVVQADVRQGFPTDCIQRLPCERRPSRSVRADTGGDGRARRPRAAVFLRESEIPADHRRSRSGGASPHRDVSRARRLSDRSRDRGRLRYTRAVFGDGPAHPIRFTGHRGNRQLLRSRIPAAAWHRWRDAQCARGRGGRHRTASGIRARATHRGHRGEAHGGGSRTGADRGSVPAGPVVSRRVSWAAPCVRDGQRRLLPAGRTRARHHREAAAGGPSRVRGPGVRYLAGCRARIGYSISSRENCRCDWRAARAWSTTIAWSR